MDHVYLLNDRLKFVVYFYDISVLPFREIMRKIEAYEPPYECPPDYIDDAPPFLEEHMDAHRAINFIGITSVGMIVSLLKTFLDEFREYHWSNELKKGIPGWYGKYKDFFDDDDYRWELSGADLGFIQQMILLRNDDQHARPLFTEYLQQGDHHRNEFPDSAFLDGHMRDLGIMEVTRENLLRGQEEVRKLCTFLQETCDRLFYARAR